MCEVQLTSDEEAALRGGKTLKRMGTCTARIPVLGCRARIERGRVAGVLCID